VGQKTIQVTCPSSTAGLRYLPVCSSRLCGTDPPEALLLPGFGDETFKSGRVVCHAGDVGRTGSRCCYLSGVVAFAAGAGRCSIGSRRGTKLNARGCGEGGASTLTPGVVAAGEASHREPTHAVAAHGCRLNMGGWVPHLPARQGRIEDESMGVYLGGGARQRDATADEDDEPKRL